MAKLSQLLTLESMLEMYDNMNVNDEDLIIFQATCIEKLVDNINSHLHRLLNSKVVLSARNVLLANYETMTKNSHWLKYKLFTDLPKAVSKQLRDKIDMMVELLKQLMMKIIDVDVAFAEKFFARLRKIYCKNRTTHYEVWKKKKSRLTMNLLERYQAELTAKMLMDGILAYDDAPTGEEMEGVDLEKLRKKVDAGMVFPEGFKEECAKLRRYSHWEGNMFIIDYNLLRKYLFRIFGKFTSDQHIALFEYDVQMKQVHEDMKKLMKKPRSNTVAQETFADRTKAILRKAAMKNGQLIVSNARGNAGSYLFNIDAECFCKAMDDMVRMYNDKLEEFLGGTMNCVQVTKVCFFIGQVISRQIINDSKLQLADMFFAFEDYYTTSTVQSKMSIKSCTDEEEVLLGTFEGLLRRYKS